jgi:hypothetical protein
MLSKAAAPRPGGVSMTTERDFRFTPNVVVGATVMLLGIVLLLDNVGALEARALIRLWPLFLVVFGGSVVLQAMRGGPVANERPIVSPGFVIFLVIGFLVFSHVQDRRARANTPSNVSVFAVMGADTVGREGQPFDGGDVTTVMGRAVLDLRGSQLAPGQTAVVDVFNMMGRTAIYVPPGWVVDVEALRLLGKARITRPSGPADAQPEKEAGEAAPVERAGPEAPAKAPRLIIRGLIMMGNVTVSS